MRDEFSVYIERSVLFGIVGPFDKGNDITHDLYTGNAAGMNTTAAVYIVGGSGIKPWFVGMTCNEMELVLDGKIGQALFYPVLLSVIFGGAGGIQHTEML